MNNQDDDFKPLVVTFAEAGRLLAGSSARTIRRLVEKGELSTIRIMGRVGIPVADLEAWVKRNTRYAPQETTGPIHRAPRASRSSGQPSDSAAVRLHELIGPKPSGESRK